ncbi:MAG: flavodoxin family protein [Deltaproteobacteria bacterium]|jgi:multimeric flavodoxin WrbA|nr:flavodoxin family protein [Deltaproteobacteria bacterium]
MPKNTSVEILGLHLSPRKKGSSRLLLDKFKEGAESKGARFEILSVSDLRIKGCVGCFSCTKDGKCVIKDDDMRVLYEAWEKAERVVVSTSIYFYDMPSQGKAVLDRSQAFWARRYELHQNKEDKPGGRGFLLAVGATKGKELFTPVTLVVKYLFDSLSISKKFPVLAFRGVEGPDKFTSEQLEEVVKAGEEFAG